MKAIVFLCMLSCLMLAGCPQVAPVEDQGAILNPGGNSPGDDSPSDGGTNGDDQGSSSQDNAGPQPPGSGDDNPPPDGDNPPVTDISDIPQGEYGGVFMATAQLDTRSDASTAQREATHIGSMVRISDDGLPYVSDRWLSDGGGVASEGLSTFRLVNGPSTTYLVLMTIDQLEIESDMVRVHWSIDASSPYWCDQGACVDTYEYDSNGDLIVTTAVQLKWDDGGTHTLNVSGQATFGPR